MSTYRNATSVVLARVEREPQQWEPSDGTKCPKERRTKILLLLLQTPGNSACISVSGTECKPSTASELSRRRRNYRDARRLRTKNIMNHELSQTPVPSAESLGHHDEIQPQPPKYRDASSQTDAEKELPLTPKPTSQYLSGIKLTAVVVGATLVVFLIMLDVSIISTVSLPRFTKMPDTFALRKFESNNSMIRRSHESLPNFTHWRM